MTHAPALPPGPSVDPDVVQCLQTLKQENEVLVRTLGSIQRRVTAVTGARERENETLRALVVRLRGELLARDTLLAALREELAAQRRVRPRWAA